MLQRQMQFRVSNKKRKGPKKHIGEDHMSMEKNTTKERNDSIPVLANTDKSHT